MLSLVIEGSPQGKDRPRFGNGRTFTSKKTLLAEGEIVRVWEQAGKPRLPEGAIALEIKMVVSRPAGHYKKNGDLSSEGLRNPYPMKVKPDADNCAKLVMDALNKRAWHDDVRVVRLKVSRVWGPWPRTEVRAIPLPVIPEASSIAPPSAQEQTLAA